MPHVEDLGFRDVPNALGEREGGAGGWAVWYSHTSQQSLSTPASKSEAQAASMPGLRAFEA